MTSVFESVFSSIDAFVYRCKNDDDYTMEYMDGGVEALTGYLREDILGNKNVSYVGLTVKADVERVFSEVDAAIDARKPWDVAYRIKHVSGRRVWVRERGCAIYENGELSYLQGLVVGAEAEFALHEKINGLLENSRRRADDIASLSGRITNSVSQLSGSLRPQNVTAKRHSGGTLLNAVMISLTRFLWATLRAGVSSVTSPFGLMRTSISDT